MTPADQARPLLRKAMQDLTLPERLIGDPFMEVARLDFHLHQAEPVSEGWAVA